MSDKFVFLVALLVACALVSPGPAHAQYGEVVRCESRDYRQVYCNIDSRDGVRIVRQLSDTACVEGRSWGWDRRGVWVSSGCRAEFASNDRGYGDDYGYGGRPGSVGGGGRIVRCESRDYNQVYCPGNARGGARLVNQLSSTACIEGRTWGADRRGLWVRGGCRGEFELGYGGGGLPIDRPSHGGGIVVCESDGNRYRHCPARVRRDARIVRKLSDSSCVFNRSWGYDRNGVWVDRGCRAEFEVN